MQRTTLPMIVLVATGLAGLPAAVAAAPTPPPDPTAAPSASAGTERVDGDVDGPLLSDVAVTSALDGTTEPARVSSDGGTVHVRLRVRDASGLDGLPEVAFRDGLVPFSPTTLPRVSGNAVDGWYAADVTVDPDQAVGDHSLLVRTLRDTLGYPTWPTTHPGIVIGTPNVVRSVAAAAQPNRDVRISWQAPVDDGGNPLTGYRLEVTGVEHDGVDYSETVELPAGARSVLRDYGNYPAGEAITFRVVAVNVAGESRPAAPATIAAIPATAPTAPRNVAVLPLDDRVVVHWDRQLRTGGHPVTYTLATEGGEHTCSTTQLTCTVDGLAGNTSYDVSVHAENRVGASSPAATGDIALPAAVNVGTFNIQSVSLDHKPSATASWRKRRKVVIRQVLREGVDVLGLQEANPADYWKKRLVAGRNQFIDLRNGLRRTSGNRQWHVTNKYGFNCKNSGTTFKCKKRKHKASQADRILYNGAKLRMVRQGSTRFKAQLSTKDLRYVAWAVFVERASGRRFFFATVHLERTPEALRKRQWKQLTRVVKNRSGGLPVVVVGDFNTQKMSSLAREMWPIMEARGYPDVLDSVPGSMKAPTIERWLGHVGMTGRVVLPENTWINTANKNADNVKAFSQWDKRERYANPIDLIFASKALTVKDYEVVVDFDPATGAISGILPSDHNLVRATLLLPAP